MAGGLYKPKDEPEEALHARWLAELERGHPAEVLHDYFEKQYGALYTRPRHDLNLLVSHLHCARTLPRRRSPDDVLRGFQRTQVEKVYYRALSIGVRPVA